MEIRPVVIVDAVRSANTRGGRGAFVHKRPDDLLTEILKAQGHRIDTADSGRSALKKIQGGGYDLIIADIKMPNLSGDNLYRSLLKNDPASAARVIFATGDIVDMNTREFLESTGNPYIAKLFTFDEVKQTLDEFFSGTAQMSPVAGP